MSRREVFEDMISAPRSCALSKISLEGGRPPSLKVEPPQDRIVRHARA